jgi:hypothetical protein
MSEITLEELIPLNLRKPSLHYNVYFLWKYSISYTIKIGIYILFSQF